MQRASNCLFRNSDVSNKQNEYKQEKTDLDLGFHYEGYNNVDSTCNEEKLDTNNSGERRNELPSSTELLIRLTNTPILNTESQNLDRIIKNKSYTEFILNIDKFDQIKINDNEFLNGFLNYIIETNQYNVIENMSNNILSNFGELMMWIAPR